MEMSQFKIRSVGYVAQPLDRSEETDQRIIEIYPPEVNPFVDGVVLPNPTDHLIEGVDAEGKVYSVKVSTANTFKAEWLPFGSDNRHSAPDVMRGEQVVLWQFGDRSS